MAIVEYIAKRTLAVGHTENERYAVELPVMGASASDEDVKNIDRSPGGGIETTYQRTDVQWTMQFGPVDGRELGSLREFLDSIQSGEIWKIWFSDDDVAPLVLKCLQNAYGEASLSRTGAEETDVWTATVTALEAVPYDPTGTLPPPGQWTEENGGEVVDIYDPNIGGPEGGMDEDAGGPTGTATLFAFGDYNSGNQGIISYSEDGGASWTDITPVGLPDLTFATAYSPTLQRIVAIAAGGGGYYSDDFGQSWTSFSYPSFSAYHLIWSPLLSVFISDTSDIGFPSARAMSSPDGINWTVTSTTAETAGTPVGLFEVSDGVIALTVNKAFKTTDGSTWASVTASPSISGAGADVSSAAPANDGSSVIAIPSDNAVIVYGSSPWAAWSASSSVGSGSRSCAWSSILGKFSTGFAQGETSPDGATWSAGGTTVSGTPAKWNGMIWAPFLGKFVNVGVDGSTNGLICVSDNGSDWVTKRTLSGYQYYAVIEIDVPA